MQKKSIHEYILLDPVTTTDNKVHGSQKVSNTYFGNPGNLQTFPEERFTLLPVKITAKYLDGEDMKEIKRPRRPLSLQDNLRNSPTSSNASSDRMYNFTNQKELGFIEPLIIQKQLESPNNMPLIGVPLSLASVILPKHFSLPPSSASPLLDSSNHVLSVLENIPHGLTIPPLHLIKENRHVLNKILKDSNSIEYGTTDGRTMKIMKKVTSCNSVESGSGCETRYGSRAERESHPFHGQEKGGGNQQRPQWKSQLHFILSCIGACVGLGSFWRLPFLFLTCGKVAFLVPFLILFFIGGIPLLLAEITLGQLTQRGPAEALRSICPLMQGVGIGIVIVSSLSTIYFSLVFSESILSLGIAIGVPVGFCSNCTQMDGTNSSLLWNMSSNSATRSQDEHIFLSNNSTELNTEAVIAILVTLLFSWIIIYFSLRKSVHSIGKVTNVSATVPFLLITAFVWRALTLPGATNGLQYLFQPEWNKLLYGEVWVNAGIQVLMSVNVAFGTTIAFASYNKFLNNVTTDVWIISVGSLMSAILAVLVVFSGMGNIAFETGVDIESFEFKGPDLAFVIYPRILSRMPRKNIWGGLFFLLLLLLGLDSQFASAEVLITSLKDNTPKFLKRICSTNQIIVFLVCVLYFLCSLPFVLQGNDFLIHMHEFKAFNVTMLFLALCEIVTFALLYGTPRLCKNLLQITSKPPSNFYYYCWNYLTPIVFLILWILSWITYEPPIHENDVIQKIVMFAGWAIAVLPVLPVPVCAFVALRTSKGNSFKEKMERLITPNFETCPECCRSHRKENLPPKCFNVFNLGKRKRTKTVVSKTEPIK